MLFLQFIKNLIKFIVTIINYLELILHQLRVQVRGYEEINVPITVDKIGYLFKAYFLLVGVAIILAQFCSLFERKLKVH